MDETKKEPTEEQIAAYVGSLPGWSLPFYANSILGGKITEAIVTNAPLIIEACYPDGGAPTWLAMLAGGNADKLAELLALVREELIETIMEGKK